MRTPNDSPIVNKKTGEVTGYRHVLNGLAASGRSPGYKPTASVKISRAELILMQRACERSVDKTKLRHHAESLGVSVDSLRSLRIGWYIERQAWTFPMISANGEIVGIRVRRADGAKWSITGGSEGIFVPQSSPTAGVIVVCEGPTSTAAWLDIGFPAIGRPSCSGGVAILKDQLANERRAVLIVADRDSPKKRLDGSTYLPGQDGAQSLCDQLTGICRARWLVCPVRKDGRDWLKRGATKTEVMEWIRSACGEKQPTATTRVA